MLSVLNEILKDKKVVILGFGREGQSTYKFLRSNFSKLQLIIADANPNVALREIVIHQDKNVRFFLGNHYLEAVQIADIVIKTPGISLNNKEHLFQGKYITSQTDLFLRCFHKQVIGITGTKGKSTTSSLIAHILKQKTDNVLLLGNIGVPPFEGIDKIDENTLIVQELSSHQLEYITKAPHVSLLLNLYQEHLDHYASFEEYQLAKMQIALKQTENDYFIYSGKDELIHKQLLNHDLKSKLIPFSFNISADDGAFVNDGMAIVRIGGRAFSLFDASKKYHLKGEHNLLNMMAAASAAIILGYNNDEIERALDTFVGLEHRIEYVGCYNKVHYYNDSIATIPEAAMEAVKTLKVVDTLLLGGCDRGIDYSKLIDFIAVSQVNNLIFIAEAGDRMLQLYNKKYKILAKSCFKVTTFEEAVEIGVKQTQPDKICLLSPAAASYGMFKNFEERGKKFKELVKRYSK